MLRPADVTLDGDVHRMQLLRLGGEVQTPLDEVSRERVRVETTSAFSFASCCPSEEQETRGLNVSVLRRRRAGRDRARLPALDSLTVALLRWMTPEEMKRQHTSDEHGHTCVVDVVGSHITSPPEV